MNIYLQLIVSLFIVSACVKYLLNRVGNYINPIVLVKRISSETKIPGLKSDLVKMMQDYTLQVRYIFYNNI